MVAREDGPPHPADEDDYGRPLRLALPRPQQQPQEDGSRIGLAPPHSEEAESELLAAVLVDPNAIELVLNGTRSDDFYYTRHEYIYRAYYLMSERGIAIDPVTLRQTLIDLGVYEKAGGPRSIGELLNRAGTVANITEYIATVRQKSVLRKVLDAARAVEVAALGDVYDVEAFITASESQMERAFQEKDRVVRDERIAHPMFASHVIGRATSEPENAPNAIYTGIRDLDAHIGGIGGGENPWYTVIYGPPECGKTSLALKNIMIHNSGGPDVSKRLTGALVSLEMSREECYQGLLQAVTGVPQRGMRRQDLSVAQRDPLYAIESDFVGWPIEIFDDMMTADEIFALAKKLKARPEGLDYIIVDNMAEVDNGLENDTANQAKTSRVMVNIKKKLKVNPFLIAHTTVESGRDRSGHAKSAANIKGSGTVLAGADLAMTVLRGEEDREACGIHIGKGRFVSRQTWYPEMTDKKPACGWRFHQKYLKIMTPDDPRFNDK